MSNRSIAFLLLVSYAFYWSIAEHYIACLIFVSMLTLYCGRQINRYPESKNRYLYLAIFGAIGQLALFKLSGIHPSIPLGLSFYTLASLTYIFDIYRGKLGPARSIRDYALFVSFFPLVTSGPIARARELLPQFNAITLRSEDLRYGTTLIAVGLIKKFAIADNIGIRIGSLFQNPQSYDSAAVILATFAFGIQLYLDFSGYSDIAIGSARVLGFKISPNFNIPYLATNPSEFWHRWNISLSSFLRDYLYIPLGGNRMGNLRTYLNLMITMVLCGLWHGATWNFLIWGAYHGGLLTAHRLITNSLEDRFTSKFWVIPKVITTQYFVFLGWLFFRISDLNALTYCLNKFLFFDISDFMRFNKFFLLAPIILFLIIYKDRIFSIDWVKTISLFKLRYWIIFLITAIMLVIVLAPSSYPTFIYQAF